MAKDKRKSFKKIKYKFKLVYLLGTKIPLSLWFLILGFEPEAMLLTSVLELTLTAALMKTIFATAPIMFQRKAGGSSWDFKTTSNVWKALRDVVDKVWANRNFGAQCWKHTRWKKHCWHIVRRTVRY